MNTFNFSTIHDVDRNLDSEIGYVKNCGLLFANESVVRRDDLNIDRIVRFDRD